MPTKKPDTTSIEVLEVTTSELTFAIIGATPLVCNAMSAKARQDLILPPKKKNAAEKASTLKHDPIAEYRRSPYKSSNADDPTLIVFPSGGFKKALSSAALDLPGANKSQIGRLAYVQQHNIGIYGVPQLYMAVVRSADMNRTPDVRTRAILPEWACMVTVRFVTPLLTETAVSNLMASAGITVGIGDGRPQKGALNFGQFRLCAIDDPDFVRITTTGGREAQAAAMENPRYFDNETEELMDWFEDEARRRGFKVTA
jgi:hypothetical protein